MALVAEGFISLSFLFLFLLPHCLFSRAPVQRAATKMQDFGVFFVVVVLGFGGLFCWALVSVTVCIKMG